ncbi:hypothetical protein F5876DRAFT_80993 [Lentinula aff. lateritia]|uniref:Uncharacterized protein n=1 Tax=Lentinula aff. lateritia TaxID=2804960 RepID=A0ACC1TNM8_9AGAR|nr:hypothetical protein F5876DRAFT_80993 [Lentinula aff. lateritia]
MPDRRFLADYVVLTPGIPFPTTEKDVTTIEKLLNDDIQSGWLQSPVSAFLLGTGCTAPMIVSVPLDMGLTQYRSIDDLYTSSYIYRMFRTGLTICDDERVHINRFPIDSDALLPNPFTFYFCGQHDGLEVNNFVERHTVRLVQPDSLWSGNILVLKHAKPVNNYREDRLVNVDAEDLRVVKIILEWLISKRFVSHNALYPAPLRHNLHFPNHSHIASVPSRHPVFASLELRDVNAMMYKHITMFLKSRVSTVLSSAFPPSKHLLFMEYLDRYRSFIVGSAAYQVLDPRVDYTVNNLNIVALRGWRCPWASALGVLGCEELGIRSYPYENFLRFVDSHSVFLSPTGLTITLTIVKGDSITPFLVSGNSTAETVALGSHYAYSFYPDLLERGITLPLQDTFPFTHDSISLLNSRSTFDLDNTKWDFPCGRSCPMLLRRSRGGRGIASFCWGGMQSPPPDCYEPNWGSFDWRLATECSNKLCVNYRLRFSSLYSR